MRTMRKLKRKKEKQIKIKNRRKTNKKLIISMIAGNPAAGWPTMTNVHRHKVKG